MKIREKEEGRKWKREKGIGAPPGTRASTCASARVPAAGRGAVHMPRRALRNKGEITTLADHTPLAICDYCCDLKSSLTLHRDPPPSTLHLHPARLFTLDAYHNPGHTLHLLIRESSSFADSCISLTR